MSRTQPPLPLGEPAPEWHLDPHTREIGRQALAEARALLAAAAARGAEREAARAAELAAARQAA
jgi:hypothetical protein